MLSSIYPVSVTVRDGQCLINKITNVSTWFFCFIMACVLC